MTFIQYQTDIMDKKLRQAVEWYAGARQRALRRRSPWNLILIPLGLCFWLGIWYGLFRFVWLFHITLFNHHRLQDFWQEGISLSTFILSFLMVFALMPGALCLGLALTNCVAWLIAPARRAFDAESVGYPGTSFHEAASALFLLSAWTVPTGLAIALAAAWALTSLK
jgi:hypothetical protein